jgi:hypothetical protein
MSALTKLKFRGAETILDKQHLFPTVETVQMKDICNMQTTKGLCVGIVSNEKLVNVVSGQYGLLRNEDYFTKVFEELDIANISYDYRSINHDNRRFALDIILTDESYAWSSKGGDEITPFLRFINSYDGSEKTCGTIGFFRKVCQNGMHLNVDTKIGFSIKHTGNMTSLVMPNLQHILHRFMDNDFFAVKRKFEVMCERKASAKEIEEIVRLSKIWMWEKSVKNDEPSLNSRNAIDIMEFEAIELGVEPNLFMAYNAVQNVLHNKLKKSFSQQSEIDKRLFQTAFEMAY